MSKDKKQKKKKKIVFIKLNVHARVHPQSAGRRGACWELRHSLMGRIRGVFRQNLPLPRAARTNFEREDFCHSAASHWHARKSLNEQ